VHLNPALHDNRSSFGTFGGSTRAVFNFKTDEVAGGRIDGSCGLGFADLSDMEYFDVSGVDCVFVCVIYQRPMDSTSTCML